MYDGDFDEDDLGIVCEDEVTREQIKAGLWSGTWKVHCRDSQGRTWFIPTGLAPRPEPEDDMGDVIAGEIVASRAEKNPDIHYFEAPEDDDDA